MISTSINKIGCMKLHYFKRDLILVLVFYNCSNEKQQFRNTLEGCWSLVNVSCECIPINLGVNEHTWTFNISKSTITVENSVTEKLHTLLGSGNYNVKITADMLVIGSITHEYYFEEGSLYLADHQHSDGPLIKFVKS